MLPIILLIVVALLIVLGGVVLRQPSEFRMVRSATMKASASTIFEQVNDLHQWNAWSPWAKLDPNAKNTFEGPQAGTGSVMTWDGNKKVGAGIMTVMESRPSDLIRLKLEFLRPFKATNAVEFTFTSQGGHTIVIWSMSGKNGFMSKLVGLLMNCEKMVGGQFDQGLANLKALVEKE